MGSNAEREFRDRMVEAARKLRANPTESELKLWEFLRKKHIGNFKFRRQHIIQSFIVDFYCPQAKLIIEVDGPVHEQRRRLDKERDALFIEIGYRILHFQNKRIESSIGEVLREIVEALMTTSRDR